MGNEKYGRAVHMAENINSYKIFFLEVRKNATFETHRFVWKTDTQTGRG